MVSRFQQKIHLIKAKLLWLNTLVVSSFLVVSRDYRNRVSLNLAVSEC